MKIVRRSFSQRNAATFLDAGFGLVPIPLGKKGPNTKGWQERQNVVFGAEHVAAFDGINAGLVHKHSGTCAIDIDDYAAAAKWFAEHGVRLKELLDDDHAVTVSSGTKNRAKLLYRVAEPLQTTKISEAKLEFRCAGSQDVIAGEHPSGSAYTVRGAVAAMPELPAALLKLWRGLIGNGGAGPQIPSVHQNKIPKGTRNDSLYRLARTMHGTGAAEAEILAALTEANKRCSPPMADADIARLAQHADTQADRPLPAKATIAEQLIGIGQQCGLFHDERNDAYAVASNDDVQRILRLRGREFRRWLCGSFYATTGKAANGEAIAAALGVLEAQATFDAPQHPLANRFADRADTIYIDLCDEQWRAARVTAAGWEIVARPPLLFRRYSHQRPMPMPERGDGLSDLAKFMHLHSADDHRLVEAFIVAAPFANDPRPALNLYGPQGAAKSTTARVLKSLLDPSATDTVELGRDPAALAQVLDHNAVPIFDNLTHISTGWASDLLCKAVTGGGFSKRELYTDAEDIIWSFKRAMIFTGINIPTHAPDLLDRLLLIELDRIDPAKRRDERELWGEFERVRPRLFGALLDAVAGVLRERERVRGKLAQLPRMADFTLLACAHAESIGLGAAPMLKAIIDNAEQQTVEAIESDSLAVAVRDFAQTEGLWNGTPTELLKRLNVQFADGREAKPEDWPKKAQSISKRLHILATSLAEVGIEVTFSRSGKTRSVRVANVRGRKQASQASQAVTHLRPEDDGSDGSDGSLRTPTPPLPHVDYREYKRLRALLAERRKRPRLRISRQVPK